jgi:hypothetical protein
MHRRRLLTLGTERTLEISCERLFMQCLASPATTLPQSDGASWGDAWQPGEPPTLHAASSVRSVVEQVARDLRGVSVARLIDTQWLVGEIRVELDRVLTEFRERGGRVEVGF